MHSNTLASYYFILIQFTGSLALLYDGNINLSPL